MFDADSASLPVALALFKVEGPAARGVRARTSDVAAAGLGLSEIGQRKALRRYPSLVLRRRTSAERHRRADTDRGSSRGSVPPGRQ